MVHNELRLLASSFEPSPAQLREASASQRRIRALLESGTIGGNIEHSFLIGSYARRTVVAPIDDIDIVFQIDPRHWNKGWPFRPDPASVIGTFHRAIKYRYRESAVRKQRRSVGLLMSRRAIDVVPALATDEDGVYLIPDVDDETWIETAPQLHAEAITEINQENQGLVVPLIKLVKVWNQCLPSTARLKSYSVESLVGHFVDGYGIADLGEGLRDFFDFVVYCGPIGGPRATLRWNDDLDVSLGRFTAHAPDLSGLDGNALAGVGTRKCIRFVDKARINRDRIQAALDRPTDGNIQRQLAQMFPIDRSPGQ